MVSGCEPAELFALLEGGARGSRAAADTLLAMFGAVREPWLARSLLQYHARTGSARVLDLLARAPEPHSKFLLDALHDQLRGDRAARHHALAAVAPLVARRPAWLHRLATHALARDLLRAARLERDPLPLLHALLALAALLPAAPGVAAPHWPELADALLRPAALDPPPPPATRTHLQLAQLALFHALYATHPCTLVETLRAELAAAGARDAWERSLAPLLHSVRLHPALVTGSRAREADATRFARLEAHDVVAETRRLSLHTPERAEDPSPPPPAPAPPAPASPAPGTVWHASRAAADLRPGTEPWFPLVERCGADSAPHTPLPAEPDCAEPPEAAVEATPENTPAKETRAQFRFPTDSTAVRAIGRPRSTRPASPPRKETSPPALAEVYGGRLSRVLQERRAADSPVPFAGAPPPESAAVARPEPRAPLAHDPEPLNIEDREVLELTARARAPEHWLDVDGSVERPAPRDPRAALPTPRARAPHARPPRRAASCEPRARARAHSVAVQTVDTWPEPYEFLVADFYRDLPDDPRKQAGSDQRDPSLPCERLDAYLSELYSGTGQSRASQSELAEQLALAHAQLMYERWRREAHAERNRRLLGRCRQARALDLHNAALRDRVRALTRERDELRSRLAAPIPPPTPAPADHEARLDAALHDERMARARAEAALHESEQQRALDAAELQRALGESFEAARHAEALVEAAQLAERRGEHVRRLRRELLVLAEREVRMEALVRAAQSASCARDSGEERTLRAALARLEGEAATQAHRAETATARAHELETALAARDAAVAELKRGARAAGEEHAARVAALQDKYEALMRVLRAAECRALERLAEQGSRARMPPGPIDDEEDAPSPAPAPAAHDS